MSKHLVQRLTEVGLSFVFLYLSGQFTLHVPGTEVPITLQSMVVIALPVVFHWKNASLGIASLLFLSALGVPLLADGTGGIEKFSGTSGGFLFTFLLITLIYPLFHSFFQRRQWQVHAIWFISCHCLLLAVGFGWIAFGLGYDIDWKESLLPFAPGMLLKSGIGTFLVAFIERLKPILS